MRQLTLEDVFRFSDLVESTKAYDLLEQLTREAEELKHQREITLNDMKQQLKEIPAEDRDARKELVDRMTVFEHDDGYQTQFGIHAFVETMKCAAREGVREDVYCFLAGLFEMETKDVAAMPIHAVVAMILDTLKQVPEDFFGSAPGTPCASKTPSGGGTRTRGGRWPFRRKKRCG